MNNILLNLLEHSLKVQKVLAAIDTSGGTGSGGTSGNNIPFKNPLGEGTTFTSLLNNVINYLILIAAPIAVVMIIYGAFQILTAGGDVKKVEEAKKTIIYALVGLTVVIISKGMIVILKQLLGASI